MPNTRSTREPKPPLSRTGIVFAFALNLLLTTGADMLVSGLSLDLTAEVFATMVAPIVAGVVTALYVRERGGMHAFLGGVLSIPVLALFIFGQNWQFAILSGLFCTLGGALTEIAMRLRRT